MLPEAESQRQFPIPSLYPEKILHLRLLLWQAAKKSRTVTDVQGQTVLESTIGGDRAIEKKYQHDDSGNVLKQTDSAGNYRTYEYDSADRQTAVNYFDENGVQEFGTEFAYDPQGNITVMEDFRYENGKQNPLPIHREAV